VPGHEAPVTATCQGTAMVRRGAEAYVAWQPDKGVVLAAGD